MGEGQEKGRGLVLNNHVAQESFYDVDLASNLTEAGKSKGEVAYNRLILSLERFLW
jgi:hypothetical protein